MAEKLNIYQKLIEVRKSCAYLQKENAGYQFKYVSSSQTLGSLRKTMNEYGLMLIPSVKDVRVTNKTTQKGNEEIFTEIFIDFTWVNADNPQETLTCPFYGQGVDSGERGVGKALTYAEKYFLLKTFNIPTDKDDPDSFQGKIEQENGNKKNGLKSNKPKVKTESKPHSNAGDNDLNNLGPHIDGVTYTRDGNLIIADGNTFQSKGLLKSAGFVWNKLKEKAWAMPMQ